MVDDPFEIIEKIEENVFKLESSNDFDISSIFNVKDFMLYHGEDSKTNIFF